MPNDHEVLFLALLVVSSSKDVPQLKEWAAAVVRKESSYIQRGSATLPAEYTKGKLPAIFEPIDAAYHTSWPAANLNQIGKAMQLFEGKGRLDEMTADRLKRHKAKENPLGWRRARTLEALFGVARRMGGRWPRIARSRR